MVPRGASEREEPIVLPPCPKAYDDEDPFAAVTSWPAKKADEGAKAKPAKKKITITTVEENAFAAVTSWPARKESVASKKAPSGIVMSKPRVYALPQRSASTAVRSARA